MNLKEKLIKEGRTRWVDVGNGGKFEEGFHYIDLFPEESVKEEFRERYFRIDVVNAPDHVFEHLGSFDLIRMQHTFEHFTYEDGQKVLQNCARLLNNGGVILISTPDLRVHIETYLKDGYKEWEGFKWWAHKRVPANSPNSFYFSIFAHSMLYESHKWCYDFEGLRFQLEQSGEYVDIKELKEKDSLANVPFTHNRPEEDVCVMAYKK